MKKNGKFALLLLAGAVFGAALVLIFFRVEPAVALDFTGVAKDRIESQRNSIWQNDENLFKNFDRFFDDEFFRQDDPFEAMRKFRNQTLTGPFDSWFQDRFGGGSVADITKREDGSYIYYEVKLDGIEGESVKTNVENGILTITGEVKKAEKSESGNSFFRSSFHRSFPLPENVDADKMEIASEKDKLILKFPKIAKGQT